MKSLTGSLIGGLPLLVLAAGVAIGGSVLAANAGPSLDATKPTGAPSFETRQTDAAAVCGGRVIAPKPSQVAAALVVVKLDGSTVRMDTSAVQARRDSPSETDDVWVIGVCRSDLR